MKIKLFIHIGQPKTGSSAIQAFLNYNRENLTKNYKVLYPNFFEDDFGKGFQHNHELIFTNAKLNNDYSGCIETFKKCKIYCEQHKITKLVISSEGFGWEWWPELLRQIIDATDFDFKIVLYLRRQDYWIESAWKQWGHKIGEYHSIHDFLCKSQMNWNLVLKNWLAVFDSKDLIVRPFEKNVIGDDVVQDFFGIIGIQDKSGFKEPPDNNLNVNSGLSPEVVEILRICNYMNFKTDDNSLLDFMYASLSERFKKRNPFKGYGFLTIEEREKIVSKYEESNLEIAKIFFATERERLFLDTVKEIDEKHIFNGLTLENTIPIFVELLFHQFKEINMLKNKNLEFSKQLSNSFKHITHNISFSEVEMNELFFNVIIEHHLFDKKMKENDLLFKSSGNDPYFVFANVLPSRLVKAVQISIQAPEETVFQLFYSTEELPVFMPYYSITHSVSSVTSCLTLWLPKPMLIRYFRVDPGTLPGNYMINKLFIGF